MLTFLHFNTTVLRPFEFGHNALCFVLKLICLTIFLADEPKSVYVRNLSPSVTESEIEQEFKSFGRIRPDGVFIRSRKASCNIRLLNFFQFYIFFEIFMMRFGFLQDIGVCYAFVEFEDLSGVHNALKVYNNSSCKNLADSILGFHYFNLSLKSKGK